MAEDLSDGFACFAEQLSEASSQRDASIRTNSLVSTDTAGQDRESGQALQRRVVRAHMARALAAWTLVADGAGREAGAAQALLAAGVPALDLKQAMACMQLAATNLAAGC